MEDVVEKNKNAGTQGMALGLEVETDVELKKRQGGDEDRNGLMDGCMMVKLKRQMVRCREGYCWEIECATHGEGER